MTQRSKRSGNSYKNYYNAYKGRYNANRIARLERHMKKYPSDEVAQDALSRAKGKGLAYRRQKPHKQVWTPELKKQAHFVRITGGNGHDVFLTEEDKEYAAKKRSTNRKKNNEETTLDDIL